MAHVLVVEDDAHIRELIGLHLGLEGLEIAPPSPTAARRWAASATAASIWSCST